MEDLFQIIFILIFIISSIASSIKKKKKKANKTMQKPAQRVQKVQPASINKKQKTSAELLEEMLGLKVNIPEPPKREAPVYSEDSINTDTWDPVSEFEVTKKETDLGTDYRDKSTAKKMQFHQDSEKHRAFKDDEVELKPKKPVKSYAKKLFEENTNLKDYIIVQEILNKPKALRR